MTAAYVAHTYATGIDLMKVCRDKKLTKADLMQRLRIGDHMVTSWLYALHEAGILDCEPDHTRRNGPVGKAPLVYWLSAEWGGTA